MGSFSPIKNHFLFGAAAVAAWLLAGCVVTAAKPGMAQRECIAGYGRPSAVVSISTCTRLQQPFGTVGESGAGGDVRAGRLHLQSHRHP